MTRLEGIFIVQPAFLIFLHPPADLTVLVDHQSHIARSTAFLNLPTPLPDKSAISFLPAISFFLSEKAFLARIQFMFRRNHTTYLPLLISGLPVFAIQWLRIAGIPAVPFQTSTLSRQGSTAAGQILIFDARNASGRLDSRMARECGAEVINVADLLPRAEILPQHGGGVPDEQQAIRLRTHRAAFFDELKLRIESAGGFWLRLADYPFPFQSALCRCQNPAQDLQRFSEQFAIGSDDITSRNPSKTDKNSVALMRESHACGRPFFISNTQPPSQSVDSARPRPLHADESPLMWQTTGEQFLKWCQLRSQLRVCESFDFR